MERKDRSRGSIGGGVAELFATNPGLTYFFHNITVDPSQVARQAELERTEAMKARAAQAMAQQKEQMKVFDRSVSGRGGIFPTDAGPEIRRGDHGRKARDLMHELPRVNYPPLCSLYNHQPAVPDQS